MGQVHRGNSAHRGAKEGPQIADAYPSYTPPVNTPGVLTWPPANTRLYVLAGAHTSPFGPTCPAGVRVVSRSGTRGLRSIPVRELMGGTYHVCTVQLFLWDRLLILLPHALHLGKAK